MEVRCGVQRYMLPPSFPIFPISGSQISDFRSQISGFKSVIPEAWVGSTGRAGWAGEGAGIFYEKRNRRTVGLPRNGAAYKATLA
jgi:hypothetical protein